MFGEGGCVAEGAGVERGGEVSRIISNSVGILEVGGGEEEVKCEAKRLG